MGYYVSSQDRDEAYARPPERPAHPADCAGWAGADAQGRPRPCLACRPWLARTLRYGRRRPVSAGPPPR